MTELTALGAGGPDVLGAGKVVGVFVAAAAAAADWAAASAAAAFSSAARSAAASWAWTSSARRPFTADSVVCSLRSVASALSRACLLV